MNYLAPDTISWTDFLIRMAAAIVFPLILGIERFVHRKPIDFRPFVIISVGSCGLMLGVVEFSRHIFMHSTATHGILLTPPIL